MSFEIKNCCMENNRNLQVVILFLFILNYEDIPLFTGM
jgi:hypothetical protein